MDINFDHVLVLDIETVRGTPDYDGLSDRLKNQWERKAGYLQRDTDLSPEELYLDRAGIYAEFGKIITIAVGYFNSSEGDMHFRVKSLTHEDEQTLLKEFLALIERFNQSTLILCGHNAKEFDFPYLCRRMLINEVPLPGVLDISGKKPWEVRHLDTMELWKFGDRKNFTSLELLASIFGIPTSKAGIDGSQISTVYYDEHDLERIADYCSKDVVVTAQLLLRLNQKPIIKEANIHQISK